MAVTLQSGNRRAYLHRYAQSTYCNASEFKAAFSLFADDVKGAGK